ncbi:MAG: thioredoxin domain-containing protein, partial [Cyclobacteriaceae bacterium]|nr:thioredoxin domain-containing protein [Cyclobacteriaceae bacterium]
MTNRIALFVTFCFQLITLTNCGQRSNQQDKSGLNRLQNAGSPYLQEHADNPVDWYEWGPEALAKAKEENKPLIISIGYAACHWCHVMERESFMDSTVARMMNENFVSIKIDREERPDIDQIYMQAAQLISGRGGWPLNAFALPDGRPFYAATYFPKEDWMSLLQQVANAYKKDNENVVRQAEALTNGIKTSDVIQVPSSSKPGYNQETYQRIFSNWEAYFDNKLGGFTGAPKFPMPVVWEFLLQYHQLTGNTKSLDLVSTTLDEMAKGGIYDHLGGGFARYSTDEHWKVPHFEKMLYDNGQLVSLYAHAYQVTRKTEYADVITQTLDFIKNELTSPDGGFYSSLNADSEGVEGKFYVWTKTEIEEILEPKAAGLITDFYQVTSPGNWEDGNNILHSTRTREQFAAKQKMEPAECINVLASAERSLLAVRNKRIHPSLDDKILVSWNGLMLKGYIDAYLALGNAAYLKVALENARFLERNMLRENGRLLRNYKDGKASIDAFLDDYALLASALIDLYQATFDIHWLETSRLITEYAIDHFRDPATGIYYYTSDESESLVARKMETADNVIPSSNSVLAEVIYQHGTFYGVDSLQDMSAAM